MSKLIRLLKPVNDEFFMLKPGFEIEAEIDENQGLATFECFNVTIIVSSRLNEWMLVPVAPESAAAAA